MTDIFKITEVTLDPVTNDVTFKFRHIDRSIQTRVVPRQKISNMLCGVSITMSHMFMKDFIMVDHDDSDDEFK